MKHQYSQQGASLIEVLVAILILSFGMLALGAMLSLGVQLPKLAGYRATAANLASSHIERVRANPEGFKDGAYTTPLSYDGEFSANSQLEALRLNKCDYPNCDKSLLAAMDNASSKLEVRMAMPAGGMMLSCNPTPCTATSSSFGNLWVVWQEPSTYSSLNPSTSDNCPVEVTQAYNTDPKPRCLYVRFKV